MKLDPAAPMTQALMELLMHERATGAGKADALRTLASDRQWHDVAHQAAADRTEDPELAEQLARAFLRGAALAAQAAEVARRRSTVFHPPTD